MTSRRTDAECSPCEAFHSPSAAAFLLALNLTHSSRLSLLPQIALILLPSSFFGRGKGCEKMGNAVWLLPRLFLAPAGVSLLPKNLAGALF